MRIEIFGDKAFALVLGPGEMIRVAVEGDNEESRIIIREESGRLEMRGASTGITRTANTNEVAKTPKS